MPSGYTDDNRQGSGGDKPRYYIGIFLNLITDAGKRQSIL